MKFILKKKFIKFGILLGGFIVIITTNSNKYMTISGLEQNISKEEVPSPYKADKVFTISNENQISEEKELEKEQLEKQGQVEEEDNLINHVSKPSFYQNILTVSNPDSILVLVNKNYALSSDYEPSDLVLANVLSIDHNQNHTIYLRKEAATHLEKLFESAKNEAGLILLARSGYRSYQTQLSLYDRYVQQNGRESADTFSARAGHSEHQTGLAIDVTADSVGSQLITDFGTTPEGIWLKENAHRFGYIIRYLEERENETGYQYEPWHIRYVGVEAATEIYENDWILEQYLNK